MNNLNYSKKIRNGIIKYYTTIESYFKNKEDKDINKYFWNSVNSFDFDNELLFVINANPLTLFSDIKTARIMVATAKMQMFTDYYRFAKYYGLKNGNNNVSEYQNIKSYEDVKKLFNDQHLSNKMFYSLISYGDLSGYDKVLLNKSLDENDVELLKNVNPFFESEYNLSNVKVDLDFLKRHIEKWQASFPDAIERSYNEASYFLFDLYKINKDECESVLIDLFRQNLGIYSCNNENEDTIKIGQVILNEGNLALMIKDYYIYEKEELIKR